jgi:peroxiredoxin
VADEDGSISSEYKVRWPIVGINQRVTYLVGADRKVRLAFHSEFDLDAHAATVCKVAIPGGAAS